MMVPASMNKGEGHTVDSTPPAQSREPRPSGRVSHRLLALSSAAVLAVYAGGYLRTKPAAQRLDAAARPRIVLPSPSPLAAPAITVAQDVAASERHTVPAPPAKAKKPRAPATSKSIAGPLRNVDTPAADSTPAPIPAAAMDPALTPTATVTPPAAPTPPPTPAATAYKDGTFSGWGTSRHGDIEATVVIEHGVLKNYLLNSYAARKLGMRTTGNASRGLTGNAGIGHGNFSAACFAFAVSYSDNVVASTDVFRVVTA